MKAMYLSKYGSPDLLELKEIEKPVPKDREVLIKIKAAAINDYDWSMVRGKPILYRLLFGFFTPKRPIPGMELSGIVEALGENVKTLKLGDEVYGDISEYGFGAFAQYISIDERSFSVKADSMSFADAASVSHASMLALQALVDKGKIQEGEKVLINGAGGGVGSFGLQLSKLYGCEVTGVDTGEKLQRMKDWGFDHVVDYKKENFTRNGEKYDLIVDAKTKFSPFSYLRSLKKEGRYVSVGGDLNRLISLLLVKGLVYKFSGKRLAMVALKANKDLDYINKLFDEKKLKTTIDGPYPLEELPRLIQYFGEGMHYGKVIVSMD